LEVPVLVNWIRIYVWGLLITNIGLSISKKLVKLMGGKIWVTSQYGQGSQFYFTITASPTDMASETLERLLRPYKGHGILFFDGGNTGYGKEIATMINQIGLIPVTKNPSDSVTEADLMDKKVQTSFDAIIVDSINTAKNLRQIEDYRHHPIVLLAPIVHISLKLTLDLGIYSYMTTPCKLVDLANGKMMILNQIDLH